MLTDLKSDLLYPSIATITTNTWDHSILYYNLKGLNFRLKLLLSNIYPNNPISFTDELIIESGRLSEPFFNFNINQFINYVGNNQPNPKFGFCGIWNYHISLKYSSCLNTLTIKKFSNSSPAKEVWGNRTELWGFMG